jgi:hypothetical protein
MRVVTAVLAAVGLLLGANRAVPAAKDTGLNDQGFITTWLILAAIPLEETERGAVALDRQQVKDEAKLDPKAGDKVKVGETEMVWKLYKCKEYFFDFNDFLGTTTEDSVGYAVCYIHADAEMKDVNLKTGSDDQARVYLNGKAVLDQEMVRGLKKDEDTTRVTLKKGVNVLVFKVVNEKMHWSGCARFTTRTGQIIKNLKVTASKPGEK